LSEVEIKKLKEENESLKRLLKFSTKKNIDDLEAYLLDFEKLDIISQDELKGILIDVVKHTTRLLREKEEALKKNKVLEKEFLKKQKEQDILLSLFDESDSVLFKWNNDLNWSIEYVSRSIYKLLEYTKDEFLDKKVIYSECIHPDDINIVFDEVKNALNSDIEYFKHKPYRLITKSGNIKWVLDNTIKVKNSNGKVTHFVGYISDITELKNLELNLEKEVEYKTAQNIKNLELLQQQSKMASMGEMIGAIAHQWRQPLNEIGLRIQNIKYVYKANEIDANYIDSFINDNKKTIMFMSRTIDDFRSFFRVDKEKKDFAIKSTTESVISMQSAQLQNSDIKVEIIGDEFICNGFQSEYQQAILNIINNARDAFLEKDIKNPIIKINFINNMVIIKDNAGGIQTDILNRVFEPYFTTKETGKGTGMGLYIAKMIIENNMNAKLDVKNYEDGVVFSIDFNKKIGK